jgi:hypothetical protein
MGGRCRRESSAWAPRAVSLVRFLLLLCLREEEDVGKKGKRRESKRKERKREKENERKNGKFTKPRNFRGEK